VNRNFIFRSPPFAWVAHCRNPVLAAQRLARVGPPLCTPRHSLLGSTLGVLLAVALPALHAQPVRAAEPPQGLGVTTTPATATTPDDLVVVERIAAVVDDQLVLLSEVEAVVDQMKSAQPPPEGVDKVAWLAQRRAQVLDGLIAERLLDAEVRKLHVEVTDAEVDRVVQATMQENGLTEDTLKMALGQQGMTLGEYRDQLKKQLTKMKIVQLKVKSRVSVTDEDVKTAARQEERAFAKVGFSRVHARHILWLVPPGGDGEEQKKKALSARTRLSAGEDFAALAAAESEDPGSKGRGGDLGTFGRGEMVPEFERAAFSAPLGVVVGPVRSAFGWHLIRVEEQFAQEAVDPAAAAAALRQKLYEKEVETQFQNYIEELKRDAFIERRL
jgi:peptidyl-prolyl cis-trans isomerase SurA